MSILLPPTRWRTVLAMVLPSTLFLGAAGAQNAPAADAGELRISGLVKQGTCQLPPERLNNPNTFVLNLPPLQTVQLMSSGFGQITPLNLSLISLLGCLTVSSGLTVQISYDGRMASLVPNSGWLRNVATVRPAQNVHVELGLISPSGLFTPLDLNNPQALNAALKTKTNADGASPGEPTLNLGVRYVAARTTGNQTASLINQLQDGGDVMPGNVSVYLPFVLNHN